MKKTLIPLAALVLFSCSKQEINQDPSLRGLYELTSKVIEMPGSVNVFTNATMTRTDMEFLEDKLVFWYFSESEGKMVPTSEVPLKRDAQGNIYRVGCREVTDFTDSTITWSQYEDGQEGVWYITHNLFYIGDYE